MSKVLDILKNAILLERKGFEFYIKVAKSTDNEGVKEIFETMAREEVLHEKYLSDQYKAFSENGKFEEMDLPPEAEGLAAEIMNEDIIGSLEAAGFEAAAISAAIDMENKAIKLYSDRAKETEDPNEKDIYNWLAKWEKSHHKILHELNEELKMKIWHDNYFWPF